VAIDSSFSTPIFCFILVLPKQHSRTRSAVLQLWQRWKIHIFSPILDLKKKKNSDLECRRSTPVMAAPCSSLWWDSGRSQVWSCRRRPVRKWTIEPKVAVSRQWGEVVVRWKILDGGVGWSEEHRKKIVYLLFFYLLKNYLISISTVPLKYFNNQSKHWYKCSTNETLNCYFTVDKTKKKKNKTK